MSSWTSERLAAEAQRLLIQAQQRFGVAMPMPEITTDLRGLQAGQAFVEEGRIRLNGKLLAEHGERFVKDTLPHELAHMVVYRLYGRRVRPHGREWQAVMELFGANPERCHQYEVQPARRVVGYQYHCQCRVHQLSAVRHARVQRGGRYVCLQCGESLRRRPPALTSKRPFQFELRLSPG